MDLLAKALEIAMTAHAGQVDKAGKPYVLHPIRMALRLGSVDERVVALLHDVVEDCPGWTFERLEADGFPPRIIRAVRAVSKHPDANLTDEAVYLEFIRRAAADPIGCTVKRADLQDDADMSRIGSPTERDLVRVTKYRRAIELIDSLSTSDK